MEWLKDQLSVVKADLLKMRVFIEMNKRAMVLLDPFILFLGHVC